MYFSSNCHECQAQFYDPQTVPEDQLLDQALRPKTFDEYIGQNRIKREP